MEIRRFATIESPQLGQMRLTTWEKSCTLFHLDPALAGQLANFSVLHAVYGKGRSLSRSWCSACKDKFSL